eukprot:3617508-Prymnesium_polylepis.2
MGRCPFRFTVELGVLVWSTRPGYNNHLSFWPRDRSRPWCRWTWRAVTKGSTASPEPRSPISADLANTHAGRTADCVWEMLRAVFARRGARRTGRTPAGRGSRLPVPAPVHRRPQAHRQRHGRRDCGT